MNPDNPMDLDKYQQAWQAHSSETRVTINSDLLRKEVERSQTQFRAMIYWRDFREVGVGLVLIPIWIAMGIVLSLPWTWYLGVPAFIWIAAYIIVDRIRHKQVAPEPGEPLVKSATDSLTQVEHQIWLLRNVFWWYILPLTIAELAFFAQTAWQLSDNWSLTLSSTTFSCAIVLAINGFVYWLNQYAVRTQLEPRRQELHKMITSLSDEPTDVIASEFPILTSEAACKCSPRRLIIAAVCFVVLLSIGLAGIYFASRDEYPKKSPYAAVRWQQSQPEVKIGDEWFKLVSIDDVPTSEILAFSWQNYHGLWRKRFEEDLVEVMTRMGHQPKDTVRLIVTPLGARETRTLENVPMTSANRKAIWDAAQARERAEREQPTRSSVHPDDAEAPFTKLIIRLRKEKDLVGLAAMVMVDGKVVSAAADGERKKASGVLVQTSDRWHLGGVTKSLTATMIARLVESGQMKWSDTVGNCFPDATIHADWKQVTLKQLLTDTAGAPAQVSTTVRFERPELGAECTLARRKAVLDVIAAKPISPPGEKFAYSNVGYTIAGAMAEKVTGATWEDLMKREVFDPLKLTGAGFGPPKSSDEKLEQPRGHSAFRGGKISVADDVDNTPIIGPAATLHMTLEDLCNFATDHLRGDLGHGKLLTADTYKLLHTPELKNYAYGWNCKVPGDAIPYTTAYWHNGSNTLWYAMVVFIPEKSMVVAVTSNDGDREKAEAAAWEIVKTSVKQTNVEVELPDSRAPQSPKAE